jgi:hypothetical protein
MRSSVESRRYFGVSGRCDCIADDLGRADLPLPEITTKRSISTFHPTH